MIFCSLFEESGIGVKILSGSPPLRFSSLLSQFCYLLFSLSPRRACSRRFRIVVDVVVCTPVCCASSFIVLRPAPDPLVVLPCRIPVSLVSSFPSHVGVAWAGLASSNSRRVPLFSSSGY